VISYSSKDIDKIIAQCEIRTDLKRD